MSTMGYVSTLAGAADAASLNLDFKNQRYKVAGVSKAFSDVVTFTRSSTAGRFNQNGVYEMVGVDQPRFDYDPATKLIKGLLTEETRTNLAIHSNSDKTIVTATRATYADVGQVFIDGSTTIRLLYEDTSTANTHFAIPNSVTVDANTSYTGSYFVKASGRTKVRLNVQTTGSWNPTNPQVTYDLVARTAVGAFGATGTITALADGFFRITMTALTGASAFATSMYPTLLDDTGAASYNGDGASGMFIGGYQLEPGAFATSYIPTPTTFVSRSSIGTYFDNKGLLQTAANDVARYTFDPVTKNSKGLMIEAAATNLFTGSDQLQLMSLNASATVTRNTTVAPDGTQTADTINMIAANSGLYAVIDTASSTQKTFSVFLKWVSGADSLVQLRLEGTAFTAPNNANFDIVAGTVSSVTGAAVATISRISSDGWFRCSVTAATIGAGTQTITLYGSSAAVKSIAAWGVQVEAGTVATSYVPTPLTFQSRTSSATYFDASGVLQTAPSSTARYDYNPVTGVSKGLLVENGRTNSLTYTDNIQAVLWTNTASSLKPNTMLAPDGTLTGTKLIEDTTTAIHYVDKLSGSGTVSVGTTYTVSAYVKAGERTRARLVGVISTAAPTTSDAFFDLTTGTVVSTGSTGASDSRIEAVGNGWYRISVAFTVQSNSAAMTPRAYYQLVNGGTTFSYAGDGVSGFYIWGPQLEIGTFPTSYMPSPSVFTGRASTATWLDSNGFMQTAAINAARTNAYMYDDTNTLKPVGLLIERNPATNLAKFSNEWTNAAWTKATGVAISTDGTLAPDGTVAQKFTLSGATGHEVWSSLTTPLTAGTTYTLSVWLKPIGAVVPSFQLAYYDGGTIVPGAGGSANNQVVGQWKRYSFTFTPSTTPTTPRIRLVGFSGGLDGNSFYMFNCQLEAGNYATSDIFSGASEVTRAAEFSSSAATTRATDVYAASTVTRAADVVTSVATTRATDWATVNNITPWYNATEGTLVNEFISPIPLIAGTYRRPGSLTGTGSNEIGQHISGTNGQLYGYIYNGTAQMETFPATAPAYVPGEVRRVAIAYLQNNSTVATKGVTSTDTANTIPTITELRIGSNASGSGASRLNGYNCSINYYPRRLTNAELTMISL